MKDDDQWIVIPRWEEFQHPDAARSNVPPWIKTYTRLLSDDDYIDLTPARRAMLHGLWLEYARSVRRLYASDTRALSHRIRQRITRRDLEALRNAGFIAFSASRPASTPASNLASRSASLEKRREEGPPTPSERGSKSSRAEGTNARAMSTNPRTVTAHAKEAKRREREAALHARVDELVARWNGGTSDDFATALEVIERNCGVRLPTLEREAVMDRVLLRVDDDIF